MRKLSIGRALGVRVQARFGRLHEGEVVTVQESFPGLAHDNVADTHRTAQRGDLTGLFKVRHIRGGAPFILDRLDGQITVVSPRAHIRKIVSPDSD